MDFEPRLTILHQAGMLSEEDCRKVQDVIRFFQEKYGLTLTEENASAMITHLCAALGRIHRGEPVEPLDEEVYEETSQEPTFPKALEATQALVREILPDVDLLKISEEEADMLGGEAELPALQRAILAQQAEYVRPGGVLLYSTCTILRRENEAVAEDFLRTHPDFVPENAPWPEGSGIAPGAMVTLLPGQHETDGFFICKFRRKP